MSTNKEEFKKRLLEKKEQTLFHNHATSYMRAEAEEDLREFPEKSDSFRTCFQIDIERIILSKAFRRLKHKTQVFWTPTNDHVRTRLTHTIEVVNLSKIMANLLGLNVDLTEAIALAHDIGHTPFGHAGERALQECLNEYNISFNHADFGADIVVRKKGQISGKPYKGLNLTKYTIDGIKYHSWGSKKRPSTLEGQVVRYADMISYISHDYDDFNEMGVPLSRELRDYIQSLGTTRSERINKLIDDIIENSYNNDKVQMSPDKEEICNKILQEMMDNIFQSGSWQRREKGAKFIIQNLFTHWTTEPDSVIKESLPEEIFKRLQEGNKIEIIYTYIACMTDNYCIEQYRRIFSPEILNYYW